MPVSIAPVPRQQYTDESGNPLVGGKLFTYLSNTSTKAATYTDGSGTSANTNPIILDDQGRIPNGLFLINGVSYSFVLAIATDTDPPTSPIFTENDITGINDTTAIDAEYALLAAAVSDMANDDILSAVEKSLLRKEWDAIASEKIVLENQADTYGITTQKTAYSNAWVALADYLNESVTWVSGVPKWLSDAEIGNDTVIVPATFRLTFRTYYDTRTTLIKQITDVANTNTSAAALTAYWTGVTGRPTDLSSLDPAAGVTLSSLVTEVYAMTSDGEFSPVEKINIRRKWDVIAIEKAIIEAQADLVNVTTEKTTYSNAWTALANYLNAGVTWTSGVPSWINDANLGTTTTIVGSTFRDKFKDYYQALSNLQKKITSNEKTYREAAQTDATSALASISDIASDSKLTPAEKLAVRQLWDDQYEEKLKLSSAAGDYGITTEKTNMNNEFATLSTYLNAGTTWSSGIPSWISDANLGTTTNITGSAFRTYWANYFTARAVLKEKISRVAVNPGTPITSSNNSTYVGANAMTSQAFAVSGSIGTTDTVSFSFNSGNNPVIIHMTSLLTSTINDSGGGYSEIELKLEVGGSTVFQYVFARIKNSSDGTANVATAARAFYIASPGSGSLTYQLTATLTKTGSGTGGSVGKSSLQLTYLKF